MMVIVLRNAPMRLRGRLSLWMLEIRAGVYVGTVSARVRNRIWKRVCSEIASEGAGNAVMCWSARTDSGFKFETFGENRRNPVDFDGVELVSFDPVEDEEESMLAWMNEMYVEGDWTKIYGSDWQHIHGEEE